MVLQRMHGTSGCPEFGAAVVRCARGELGRSRLCGDDEFLYLSSEDDGICCWDVDT